MSVYILHFHTPLKHARHYTGYAKDVDERFQDHVKSMGARITQVCNEQGITYEIARVFKGKKYNRTFERKLKRTHKVKLYCPLCMDKKVRKYKPEAASK